MRVTYINKYYPPHLGGIEGHLADLATSVAAREGFAVRAIVANEGPETVREIVAGVDVLRLGRSFAYASTPVALGMRAAIGDEASRHDPADVIHLHFPYPWGEVAWLSARPNLPSVLTYHSDIVRQKVALTAYRPFLRRLLDRVDAVIASSPNMVEHSEFLAPIAEKCRVIPFGIDISRFLPTPEIEARAGELRGERERPLVLFVGRLIYYKGVDVLVRAMAEVDADLVIVGTGPLEGHLREIATARGVSERITFLPPVDDIDLRAWYRAADIFCLPSVARSEAFGLVQLEAHASGVPVVSTRLTTGVPFVNQDGVTGLTVPVGDEDALAEALRKLAEDEGLRKRLGAQAFERAHREFTIERMVDETIALYEELV